jgi:hypothetical protein
VISEEFEEFLTLPAYQYIYKKMSATTAIVYET